MATKNKVKKPRISEYGNPHAVRFRKNIDRELGALCLQRDIRPSRIIQAAVECFLRQGECLARNKILQDL